MQEQIVGQWYFILAVALVILLSLSGCQSVRYVEVDPKTGIVIKDYERTGFINWSDGEGKIMPFGQISVNGVGIDK